MEEQLGETSVEAQARESVWVKTPVANLVRYKPSGTYFARVRIRGKLFRQALNTTVISVAKLKLADFTKEKREEMGDEAATQSGRMTIADAVTVFRERLAGQQNISNGAKVYREKCLTALLKSWPELSQKPVSKITKDECLAWAKRFAQNYSASVYNNTVGTLRMLLNIAVEKGLRAQNPAATITKKRVSQREIVLPSPSQFSEFVLAIESAGAWCSKDCADLVRFLAFGGYRKTEASHITWADCDLTSGQIRVRITKNGKPRSVPMIQDMRVLLERLKSARPEAKPSDPIMKVRECQKAMDNAAKKLGAPRVTHHDLRHLFATRCIESGVDIPTVSRWLGHQDGGALAMKVYGHLRDAHSEDMAKRVRFSMLSATSSEGPGG